MFKGLIALRYVRPSVVFAVDILLSISSTFIAYLFASSFFYVYLDIYGFLPSILLSSLLISAILFHLSGIYREIIRHFSISCAMMIILLSALKAAVACVCALLIVRDANFVISAGVIDFLCTSLWLVGVRGAMVSGYYFLLDKTKKGVVSSLIYSTRGANPTFVEQVNKDASSAYRIRGFITTNKKKVSTKIVGLEVYDVEGVKLKKAISEEHIEAIIFTSAEAVRQERNRLVEFCIRHKIKMLMAGGIEPLDERGNLKSRTIKPIQIEDLLEREEIDIEEERISREIKGQVVMVTGAAGSIGSEIVRQVARYGAKKIVAFDIAETPIHNIYLELSKLSHNVDIEYVLGDARSTHRVRSTIEQFRPSIIFHAAAYKHVPLVESNPCEGVLDNVWGSVNVAQRAMECGVKKFVMISTDKAVNPTSVMGATKRIAEMCVQSMCQAGGTEFITTRFGNVLGSNGSVIPHFKSQIEAGGPVTVTHPDIIRYFMTIPESCRLVLQAATMGHAGEILVFDMGEQVRIVDLACKMIRLSGFEPHRDIDIEYTGLRPGEKLYEELLTSRESTTATQHKKIRIAHSSIVEQQYLSTVVKQLIIAARRGRVDETIILMKRIIPEFKSMNSVFEKFDS